MTSTAAKVEGIFPLRHVQRALLVHHLSESVDQGIIQNRFLLSGLLDEAAFLASWQRLTERHAALRTSVHWEGIDQPMLVVRPLVPVPLVQHDWTARTEEEHQLALTDFLHEEVSAGMELSFAPNWKLTLIKLRAKDYQLIWTTHHLLIDGWSAAVILRDFFAYYAAEAQGEPVSLPSLPSYRTYLNWLAGRDESVAADFWRAYLQNATPTRFAASNGPHRATQISLTETQSSRLRQLTADLKLSLNTVFQGIYALLLGEYFATKDVCFGTVVSGRSPELINLDYAAGLFANTIPVRVDTEARENIQKYLAAIQHDNVSGSPHHYADLAQVFEWAGLGGGQPPFNSLFLFQNHRWDELSGGGLSVSEFQGDLTVNFPLSCVVIPGSAVQVSWHYREGAINQETIDWLAAGFVSIVDSWLKGKEVDLPAAPPRVREAAPKAFVPPGNPTELRLAGIWEDLLGRSPIGIEDDFFAIGGTSLLALRLFARIEREWEVHHSPITLVEHRTIRSLAKLIEGQERPAGWSTIVPLKASGNKSPIFCIHGGAGHVFFYHPLTKHVDADRPLYAVQPEGLDGVSAYDGTIEEMADRYLNEMRRINPGGRLILVAFCFSTAVCLEIGKRVVEAGEEPPIIIVVDSSPGLDELTEAQTYNSRYQSRAWYLKSFLTGRWRQMIYYSALRWLPIERLPEHWRADARVRRIRTRILPSFMRYVWPIYSGPVLLLRSSDFAGKRGKDFQVEVWQKLAPNDLAIEAIDGSHYQIFEPPMVAELGRIVEDYLAGR